METLFVSCVHRHADLRGRGKKVGKSVAGPTSNGRHYSTVYSVQSVQYTVSQYHDQVLAGNPFPDELKHIIIRLNRECITHYSATSASVHVYRARGAGGSFIFDCSIATV